MCCSFTQAVWLFLSMLMCVAPNNSASLSSLLACIQLRALDSPGRPSLCEHPALHSGASCTA